MKKTPNSSNNAPEPSERALQHSMTEEDLQGYSVDDVRCLNCAGAFCGSKTIRLYKGEPMVLCLNKEAAREVLRKSGK